MTVLEFANHACEHLPEGWNAALEMEQGAGGVTLVDPEGNEIPFEDFSSVDHTLEEQIRAAVRYANGEREP